MGEYEEVGWEEKSFIGILYHLMNINIKRKKKECKGYKVLSAFEVLKGKYNPISHLQQQKAGLGSGGYTEKS